MAQVTLPANNFVPRWYQLPLWKYMEQGGKRAAVVWPRRHGKDILAINWTAVASQLRVGTYWMVYPYLNQGRRIAWTGMDKQGRKFLSAFPDEIVKARQNAEMRLELKNGSVFQIMGADQPDRFVGSNPVGIVFSEWPLMNPLVWKLTAPILAENGGWAMWIYTPRGTNHGLDTLNEARVTKGWFHSKLTAADCKVLTAEDLRTLRSELKDDALFRQEAFTSFSVPLAGAYYFQQFKHLSRERRFVDLSVETALPVTTAWDLGMNDETAIWFVQESRSGEIRVVDYYENNGFGMSHYAQHLKQWADDHGATYKEHIGPHDLSVREMGTGKSRLETARELGIRFRVARKLSVEDGVEAVRNLLPKCWFDRVRTRPGVNALKSYARKFSEEKGTYENRPEHNWASHASDAFRYLAVGMRRDVKKVPRQHQSMQTDYDIFASL